jgi:hypothetical protein
MNDTAVVTGLMLRDPTLFFEQCNLELRARFTQRERRRQTDDARANDSDVLHDFSMGR